VQKGYSNEFLAACGLFSSRYPQVSLFSGRLMFPIADRQGRQVAFGGRFLPDARQADSRDPSEKTHEPPKYINSPELSIYKKGETLFAVDLALSEIRRTKTVYIAEGYMDVIALHQSGITNAVAPLGTAFTDDQAKLVKRWAENVILFFDYDAAGKAAALKGIYTCRKNGLSCSVVVPSGENQSNDPIDLKNPADLKDPADILLNSGAQMLQKSAKWFINDFDYLIITAKSRYGGRQSKVEGKAQAVAFLFPYLDTVSSEIERGSCIELIADSFGLLPALVTDDYRRYASGENSGLRGAKKEVAHSRHTAEGNNAPIRMNDELSLLIVVAVDYISSRTEKVFSQFRSMLEIREIDDPHAKGIFIALEECIRYGETGIDEFLARISSPALRDFFIERSATGEFSVNSTQLVADGIRRIKEKRLKLRQEDIIVKLRELKKDRNGAEEDPLDERDLLSEKMRIDSELNLLKQGR